MSNIETRTAQLNYPIGGYWMTTEDGEQVHCWYERPFMVRVKLIPSSDLPPGWEETNTVASFRTQQEADAFVTRHGLSYVTVGQGGRIWVENWNKSPQTA